MTACAVATCGKLVVTRQWCEPHYRRWKSHGDPLLGKTPRGETLRYLNEVVMAYEGDECLRWPFAKANTKSGGHYGQIRIDGHNHIVSRLVCEKVHGPAPSSRHQAAHSCGKGHEACVTKRHVSWKTIEENAADKKTHGTEMAGERHAMAKLSRVDALHVLALRGTVSQREISEQFNVAPSTISAIHTGRTWGLWGVTPEELELEPTDLDAEDDD